MKKIYNRFLFPLLFTVALLFIGGCGDVTNSPFTDETTSSLRDSNAKAPERIYNNGLPLIFTIITDSHQNHTDLAYVVKDINAVENMDFTAHLGDFTDLSYAIEYDLFIDIIKKLARPFFVAMGNHDALNKGRQLYAKHFGPYNVSFMLKGIKFIQFNNINFEFELDYEWINNEIESSPYPVVIFQHIPPFETTFTEEQMERNRAIVDNPKVKALFFGHNHKFLTVYDNDTLLQQVATVEGQNYSKVRLLGDMLTVFNCKKGICNEAASITINY